MVDEPIVKEIDDNLESLISLRSKMSSNDSTILFVSPTVYIHNWKHNEYLYDAYVGEANDVLSRTQQHFQSDEGWHADFKKPYEGKKLFIIGHPHFNKSLTLDIENRLIQYMSCMKTVHRLRNGRGNPQRRYYPCEEFDEIFRLIWGKLHEANDKLFVSEQDIRDSALFKCSPLHRLSDEQLEAKRSILEIINKARTRKNGNLVFVEGEAGTGKSVLMSSLFYDLVAPCEGDSVQGGQSDNNVFKQPAYKCRFIINHNEQLTNFNSIFRRLGLSDKDDIVTKAVPFINKKEMVDVAFVDEAHLLCTQGNQGYSGKDQLEDIMRMAKTTVIIFDEHQILTREQYVENETLIKRRDNARMHGLYYQLRHQLRIQASAETQNWIDGFSLRDELLPFPKDEKYDLRIFADVAELYGAIKEKAGMKDSRLSRVIASYDWPYNNTNNRKKGNYEVEIGSWHLPWNYEISRSFSKEEKKKNKDLSWAEQEHTIREVGSTFTIQGFDLTYSGVILGPSVSYDKKNGKIKIKGYESKNSKVTSKRTCNDGGKKDISEYLVRHELRVLMTRGVKGMFIYAVDKDLREALLRLQRQLNASREVSNATQPIIYRDVDIKKTLMYVDFLPIYSMAVACGPLADGEEAAADGWVKVRGHGKLDDTQFVVKTEGVSMEGLIPEGAYAIFRKLGGGNLDGKTVLVQCHEVYDPESGGAYTVKRFTRKGDKVILKARKSKFDIELNDEAEYSTKYRAIAEFKAVL